MGRWKKALFIYPYKKIRKLSYNDFFPPLGLEYIATAVKELVEELTIIDSDFEKEGTTAKITFYHRCPFCSHERINIHKLIFKPSPSKGSPDRREMNSQENES